MTFELPTGKWNNIYRTNDESESPLNSLIGKFYVWTLFLNFTGPQNLCGNYLWFWQ